MHSESVAHKPMCASVSPPVVTVADHEIVVTVIRADADVAMCYDDFYPSGNDRCGRR